MGGTVLLIEDEPNITEAIRFILSRDGWRVETHANGATAIAAVEAAMPDLIILDAMLPDKSGFDILGELRARDDFATLPILMLTARGQERDRERANALGASQFMTKPFSNEEVLATVRDLVAG